MPRCRRTQLIGGSGDGAITLQLPEFVREPFSAAMSQSVLLPAFIALFGIVAALFLVGFTPWVITRDAKGGDLPDGDDVIDDDYDDDDYVELILRREPGIGPPPRADIEPAYREESDIEPLAERFGHPRRAPADAWHSGPVDSWHSLLRPQRLSRRHRPALPSDSRKPGAVRPALPSRSGRRLHQLWPELVRQIGCGRFLGRALGLT